QETLFSGAGERFNRYSYMVRADVETHTYLSITNQIVIHFDVVVDEIYYPTPFDGGNCDQPASVPTDIVGPTFVINAGSENAMICTDGGADCKPVGVKVTDPGPPPVTKNCPYGSQCYKDKCGVDPYCGFRAGQLCGTNGKGVTRFECPGANGVTYYGEVRPLNLRPTRGCASASTFDNSATGLDPDGYTFTVTTRLVSIGSTYN
ncbi:MAG: hypothetical protein HY817_01330, partial [Candidatus Abawacabacteria bacterium]|nr:hypothetical protein [Candidatus Abawacabacteria bacterium]